ncbi:hypothetical protein J8273_8946 [Carpediemonas membranifera]|uniref:Uncharacterized protein n=1 Tax=Carpediemonas membranifera TaxID=201153 RepID=A0A8J6E0Q6_9EUKA|nr:hypothetical protein J8273_8946 [Carpediemonas membranifera]|eukprot:KAG9389647.1 hypothetical protein J8273_8946 [Carpediemonas membranifera]
MDTEQPSYRLGYATRGYTGFAVQLQHPIRPMPRSLNRLNKRSPSKTEDSVIAEIEQAKINREEYLHHRSKFARHDLRKVEEAAKNFDKPPSDVQHPIANVVSAAFLTYNPFFENERIRTVPRPQRMEEYLRHPIRHLGMRERHFNDMHAHRDRREAHLGKIIRTAMKEETKLIHARMRKLEIQEREIKRRAHKLEPEAEVAEPTTGVEIA